MMNPSDLIPAADAIPAPAVLFLLLDNLLFLGHLLLVNLVVGGSLITLFSPASGGRSDAGEGAAILGRKLPLFVPFAITLGVAPLLFVQVIYGHFFYSSSVLMAVYWIAVIPGLILAYYGTYIHARRREGAPRLARAALALAAGLFLEIAFVYVNNMSLMVQPSRWGGYFKNRSGTLLNLDDPALAPRYLHFVAASVAVAALLLAVLSARRSAANPGATASCTKRSLRIFAGATGVQMAAGLWFLLALPVPVRSCFLGQDPIRTGVLWLGVLSGIGALVTAWQGKLRPTLVQLGITLVLMVATRDGLRSAYLRPHFDLSQLKLAPQYDVLFLFLVVLLAGLAIMAYMVRLAFAPGGKGGAA